MSAPDRPIPDPAPESPAPHDLIPGAPGPLDTDPATAPIPAQRPPDPAPHPQPRPAAGNVDPGVLGQQPTAYGHRDPLHPTGAYGGPSSPTAARGLGRETGGSTAAADALAALQRALPAQLRDAPPAVGVGVVAVAVLVVFGLLVIVSSASGAGSGASWAGLLSVLIGLLAVAAAFTPTMPAVWRAGCGAAGAFGLVLGASVGFADSALSGWGALMPLVPAAVVGTVGYGWWHNHRTGATATAPGWTGPGSLPPPSPVQFPLPPTAKGRAGVCLTARTALAPELLLDAVARTTAVRGNWFVVRGDRVDVSGRDDDGQILTIGGHASFRSRIHAHGGDTVLRVGGLDRWVQSRNYWGFVPVGFAHVQGYWAYKCYLQTLAGELACLDPGARMTIESRGS